MKHSNLICRDHLRSLSLVASLLLSSMTGLISSAYALDSNYAAFSDEDGDIYSIPKNGGLLWHQHAGRMAGSTAWTNSGKAKVVSDINAKFGSDIAKIFSGSDGVIYIIKKNGQLFWSRHDGRFTGTKEWAKHSFSSVGAGWNKYSHVFSGGDGVIYAITKDGKMHWFKHNGWLDGQNAWASDSGKQISSGWDGTLKVFSGGHGTIYSIINAPKTPGRLRWHLHKGYLTGADDWLNGGKHIPVGSNWHSFSQVFSGGDGVIYAVTTQGELRWHRHNAWLTGTDSWASGFGKVVNSHLNQSDTVIK